LHFRSQGLEVEMKEGQRGDGRSVRSADKINTYKVLNAKGRAVMEPRHHLGIVVEVE
jgi:hypothetical protein